MKTLSDLSLDRAPPLRTVLRFFLTAPLFGMAGGLLLLVMGEGALASRWLPGAMALTHLFTLGFITMAMCGALLQVLPVLGGVAVPGTSHVGPAVHLLLTIGTLALAGGFIGGQGLAFNTAAIALGGGLALFIAAVATGLWRVHTPNSSTHTLWGALIALLLTLMLGVYLLRLLTGYGVAAHMQTFIDIHLGWGLLGWVGLLVIGVGLQVVPLFQVTPNYPAWLGRAVPLGLVPVLVVWTWAMSSGAGVWRLPAEALLAVGFGGFAATTLWLQGKRRRRVADAGVLFWRTAAMAVLAAAILWLAGQWPGSDSWHWYPMLWGGVVIGGAALTLVNGMLYKIVPFLAWFHLQQRQMKMSLKGHQVQIPHMQQLLPVRPVLWQFRLHLAVLVTAAAAVIFPEYLARPLGGLMLLSFALLSYNLFKAAGSYRRTERVLSQSRPIPVVEDPQRPETPS